MEDSFNSEGEGPYDGGMDARVVSKDLVDMKTKGSVELKVAAARVEGRVSQLPSTVQLLGFVPVVRAVAGVTRFITGP